MFRSLKKTLLIRSHVDIPPDEFDDFLVTKYSLGDTYLQRGFILSSEDIKKLNENTKKLDFSKVQ